MKILLASDLHREFGRGTPPVPEETEYDIVVLAGDIDYGTKGAEWAAKTFTEKPVIIIPGNHEYYKGNFSKINRELDSLMGTRKGLHVFGSPGWTVIGDTYFIAATLWAAMEPNPMAIQAEINDFRLIRDGEGYHRFSIYRAREVHSQHLLSIERGLKASQEAGKEAVVITHFMPTPQGIAEKYAGSNLNGYFCTDLGPLMEKYSDTIRVWLFGHTHSFNAFEHQPSGVACVSNPHGYPGENPGWTWKVVEI